jgi:hypothetical protein
MQIAHASLRDYLKFALAHPNEYQLIFAVWPEHRDDPRPTHRAAEAEISQWMAGRSRTNAASDGCSGTIAREPPQS